MGERKVLNKYYPPDFDPAKLPRGQKGDKNQQMKVRMMLSMSVRCGTCGNYMYKGTKFTMRMEDVPGEEYLGIRVFRFYFHCKSCSAEITMKTDPKNSDYALEHGATRNYEPWRDKDLTVMEAVAKREEEEKGNAMKALENRTQDSKVEMDIMDALEELQALNGRHGKVDTEAALAALHRSTATDEDYVDAEDDAALRAMLFEQTQQVKRLDTTGIKAAALSEVYKPEPAATAASAAIGSSSTGRGATLKPKFSVKPRITVQTKRPGGPTGSAAAAKVVQQSKAAAHGDADTPSAAADAAAPAAAAEEPSGSGGGLAGLLGGYGSGSGSDASP